jgi:hypothetical protein
MHNLQIYKQAIYKEAGILGTVMGKGVQNVKKMESTLGKKLPNTMAAAKSTQRKAIAGTVGGAAVAGVAADSMKPKVEIPEYADGFERMASEAHPGFKAVAKKIAQKQGLSQESANAILASSARKASPKAIKENPRLKKINGVK